MDLASRTSSLSTLSSVSSTPPRPLKRPAFPSSTTPEPPSKRAKLAANPPTHENEATVSPEMLLALPSHLLKSYPVASPDFVKAVGLSVCALKRVLTLPQSILSPHNEIQALTGLAELAKTCLENDLGGEFGNMLLRDVTAQHLPRALHLAGTHPTLAGFRTHLALLQLSIPPHIGNVKHVRNTLKKLLKEDSDTTMRYYLYLALIDSYVSEDTVTEGDVNRIASLLEEMREIAREQGDEAVEQFTWILTLRLAMMFELWEDASEAVMKCEDFFAFNFRSPPLPENDGQTSSSDPLAPLSTSSPDHAEKPSLTLPRLLRIQVLMLSVLYHCSMNQGKKMFARLERLHEEMDKGAFGNPDGVVEVPVNSDSQKPIYIKTTPPCLLTTLAYLVSADVKRDPIGRPNKIKRRIFALEGLNTLERARNRGLTGCGTLEEVKKMEKTLGKIKVECIIELVSVGIMRSEFTQAKVKMDELVSTVLTGGEVMWSCYGGSPAHSTTSSRPWHHTSVFHSQLLPCRRFLGTE
ncbi:hypothetical protein DL96DRAFT_126663 [Flagelloscypha sp. PMI_526]|nr:hypothetical protein DL96DRAFT_126663 [Flagelloscypha sp. PMI_526]